MVLHVVAASRSACADAGPELCTLNADLCTLQFSIEVILLYIMKINVNEQCKQNYALLLATKFLKDPTCTCVTGTIVLNFYR